MYDELVKSLRCCFGLEEPAVTDCENCMMKNKREEYNYEGCCDALGVAAADAIEELSREAEEYKAAYRKEHNKRIAENRYLYDELTKAVRAKLLMTPMRIEVPEPPKEG